MKKLSTLILLAAFVFAFNTSNAQKAATTGKDQALECIGGVSAMMLYNTYIVIGSISDGYDKMHTKEQATSLLTEQVNGMDVMKSSFTKLLDSGFITSEDDKAFLKKSISCTDYLKKEASSMIKYMESKNKSDIEAYDDGRNNAWKLISDILGLNKK